MSRAHATIGAFKFVTWSVLVQNQGLNHCYLYHPAPPSQQPVFSAQSYLRFPGTARFDTNCYIPHHLHNGHAQLRPGIESAYKTQLEHSTAFTCVLSHLPLHTPDIGLQLNSERLELTTHRVYHPFSGSATMSSCCSLNRLAEVLEEGVAAAL